MTRTRGLRLAIAATLLAAAGGAAAEDGYELWLRYPDGPSATVEITVDNTICRPRPPAGFFMKYLPDESPRRAHC